MTTTPKPESHIDPKASADAKPEIRSARRDPQAQGIYLAFGDEFLSDSRWWPIAARCNTSGIWTGESIWIFSAEF